MSISTRYRHKVGRIEYQCSIGIMDDVTIETVTSQNFATVKEAQVWAAKEVRKGNRAKDGYSYDAMIQRILWVAEDYDDDEYGTIHDASYETDYNNQLVYFGVTWHGAMTDTPEWQ